MLLDSFKVFIELKGEVGVGLGGGMLNLKFISSCYSKKGTGSGYKMHGSKASFYTLYAGFMFTGSEHGSE